MGEQLENIAVAMEKRRQRKMAARNKMSEKERKEQEEKAVRDAMHEEIIFALKVQKEASEQAGLTEEVEKYNKLIIEETEKMDGTWERRERQKAKELEEKEKQRILAIENEKRAKEQEKLDAIKREEELKAKKIWEAKMMEEQKRLEEEKKKQQEKEAFERLPNWKKEKILRERAKAEEAIRKAKMAEEE